MFFKIRQQGLLFPRMMNLERGLTGLSLSIYVCAAVKGRNGLAVSIMLMDWLGKGDELFRGYSSHLIKGMSYQGNG